MHMIYFLGNSLVLLVVLRNRTMHCVPDTLIAHLSISDIIQIVFATPFLLLQQTNYESFPLEDILSKISMNVTIFCSAISAFTAVTIALER